MLTVIAAHACGGAKAFNKIPILHDPIIVSIFCQVGMCIFLFLSGYGLFLSFVEKGFSNFWNNKIDKIFIPAITIQGLYIIIGKIFLKCNLKEINISDSLGDILCVNAHNSIDGAMWYLSYLLYCYLAFYVIFKYVSDIYNIKVATFSFMVLWILTMPICTMIWENGFYCVSAFAIGVLAGYIGKKTEIVVPFWGRITVLLFCIGIGIIYYFNFRVNTILDNVVSNLIALCFIIIIKCFNIKRMKALLFLGKYSYPMYLLQGKVIFGICPYEKYSDNLKLLVFTALFAVNLVCSVIVVKFIKHLNALNRT